MATTISQKIRRALEKKLATLSGLPDVAWENVPMTPSGSGDEFIRARVVVQSQRPATVGTDRAIRHDGIFFVDIFQEEGVGAATADEMADNIRALFPVGTILTEESQNVHIRYSERAEGISDPPFYMIPLTIAWYAYET